jgi:hypothetical protein
MEHGGQREPETVQVPQLVGMPVREARNAGHQAGVVVVSADIDGPPLGGLTWPGIWIVTAQRPAAGARVQRWENVVIEFEELPGGEGAGDREPLIPRPPAGGLAAEAESPRPTEGGLSRSGSEKPPGEVGA